MSDMIRILAKDTDLKSESDLSLATIMQELCGTYAMCRAEISSATLDVWDRIEMVSKEIQRRVEKKDNRPMKWLRIETEYIDEVFEIMCDIPFKPTYFGEEPSESRHVGIEQIIDQLQWIIDDEKIAEIEKE